MHINIGASGGSQADQRVDKLVDKAADLTKEIALTDEWVEEVERQVGQLNDQVSALNKEVAELIKTGVNNGVDHYDLQRKVEALKEAVAAIPKPEKAATVDLTPIKQEVALLRARVSEIKPVSLIPVYTQISKSCDALREKIDLEIAKIPTETDVPVIYRLLIGVNLLLVTGIIVYLVGQ